MKKPIEDKIMNLLWSKHWDEDSPAHNFWRRKVIKYKKGWNWWRKNARKIEAKEEFK